MQRHRLVELALVGAMFSCRPPAADTGASAQNASTVASAPSTTAPAAAPAPMTDADRAAVATAAAAVTTVCAGLPPIQDANHPANVAIQNCINAAAPGTTVALPLGTYYMANGIQLNKNVRLTTQNNNGVACYTRDPAGVKIVLNTKACATLIATPTMQPTGNGFLYQAMVGMGSIVTATPVVGAILDHVILDGNRDNRTAANLTYCDNNPCHNIHIYRCDSCQLTNIVTAHAAQGYNTVDIDGSALSVQHSLFWDSGTTPYVNLPSNYYHQTGRRFWSNAFEVQANNRSINNLAINFNDVIDASDGGLCFAAAGANGTSIAGDVSSNYIAQINNQNWQGIVLWDTLNGAVASAPVTVMGNAGIENPAITLTIHDNTIDCNAGGVAKKKCNFGIEIGGQHEVAVDGHLVGARVRNNTVKNARIGINVDGAGLNVANATVNQWISITGNTVTGSGIPYNKAPETNNAVVNQQYSAIAAENVGANGAQVAGTTGFYGANIAPTGWTGYNTSTPCATPGSGTVVPGVFGTCSWFPAP